MRKARLLFGGLFSNSARQVAQRAHFFGVVVVVVDEVDVVVGAGVADEGAADVSVAAGVAVLGVDVVVDVVVLLVDVGSVAGLLSEPPHATRAANAEITRSLFMARVFRCPGASRQAKVAVRSGNIAA